MNPDEFKEAERLRDEIDKNTIELKKWQDDILTKDYLAGEYVPLFNTFPDEIFEPFRAKVIKAYSDKLTHLNRLFREL